MDTRLFTTRIQIAFFLFVSGLFATGDGIAQKDKNTQFLTKISRAYADLTYKAKVTKEGLDNGKIVRKYVDETVVLGSEKRWVRRIYPKGYYSDKEILHIGNLYYVKVVGKDSVLVRFRRPVKGVLSNADDMMLLEKNYYINFLRTEKVQNRTADVVNIVSRYKDRSFIKIWVDKENGFIYRIEKYDRNNNKIYQVFTEDVVFNPKVEPGLFAITYTGNLPSERTRKTYEGIPDLLQDLRKPVLVPKQIPPGFVLDKIIVQERNEEKIIQFYYKDGLTDLSFFQGPDTRKERKFGVTSRDIDGRIQGRIVKDNVRLVLVGDLPKDTLYEIFQNIELIKDEDLKLAR